MKRPLCRQSQGRLQANALGDAIDALLGESQAVSVRYWPCLAAAEAGIGLSAGKPLPLAASMVGGWPNKICLSSEMARLWCELRLLVLC